ncbi:hypothetical protein CLAFUW4_03423 [Fulvia fulva]|nr:uncharacterized protein CLAFUR5_20156 [Fulvia fulva]KAK4632274.1 hypothetical protein CLAFUR4_03412 [Fulvia fulva]KAK4632810.1 hypothetical protein CLAFUR0_03417 [Fulvia fulva]WMI38796.1 hypothetical protein CLAFUR5_20156 [Fulvia fulva]WPV11407.1 hypothetical protein CLAFUW4_03423 [Fulvia fulva]WPV25707.1 hypothetical protein CLAFUW7_03415 [Fulvia fulva]
MQDVCDIAFTKITEGGKAQSIVICNEESRHKPGLVLKAYLATSLLSKE